MKKITALFLSAVLCLSCTACGGGPGATQPSKDPGALKVALILLGSINDQGFNAMAYGGLQAIESEFGAETAYRETVAQSDMEEVIRQYASSGYDVVIGHGFEFGDTMSKVAPNFPDTKFIVTSSDIAVAPNVGSISTSNVEIGFLQGAAAAAFSQSGMIGMVSSMEIPPVRQIIDGVTAGAAYINPDAKVVCTMVGSYDDAAKGKETALSLINEGADIIMGDSNQMSLGTLEACKEKGVMFLGSVGDFSEIEPDVVVTSGVIDFSKAMTATLQKVVDGTWEAKNYDYGVKDGVEFLTPYGNFEDKLSQEQKDKVAAVVEEMMSPDFDISTLVPGQG